MNTFPFVTFRDARDNTPHPQCLSWNHLRGQLTRHTSRAAKNGPAWSPTQYPPGLPRAKENVQSVSCFVADVDDGTPANALWDRWQTPDGRPLAWCLHSSHSSTFEHPKWRAVFPLAAPVKAADWPATYRKLTLALFGDHADPACKDASRLYYLPSCPPDRQDQTFAESNEGVPLDPDDFADPPMEEAAEAQMRRAFKGNGPRVVGLHGGVAGGRPGDDFNDRGDVLALLQQHGWQVVGGRGGLSLLRRPGKSSDYSATFGYGDTQMFYCFTSSAVPFEANTGYSAFAVYALLVHGGDFKEAARTLGRQGYGDQPAPGIRPMVRESGPCAASVPAPARPEDGWERRIPFTANALPPFPVEALPVALAGYVAEVAGATQVPADMPAMIALAVTAAAASRLCLVRVGETHTEPLNLYVAVVMDPGSRKSATLEAMAFPLREAEQRLAQQQAPAITAAREKRAIEEKRLDQLRGMASKEGDDAIRQSLTAEVSELADGLPEVPASPRLLADDVTQEKLAGLLAEQDGVMAILSAEGGIFGILGGRYSASGQANLDLFLKAHAGEDYRADRVGRAAEYIPRACLTMGLAVQPDVLASLADNASFRGRGLLGRFLYSMPDSLVGTRLYRPRRVDPARRDAYGEALAAILALPSPATAENPGARHALALDGPALDLWAEYYDDVELRQAEGEDLAGVRDWASKLAGAVARIAGGAAPGGTRGRRPLPVDGADLPGDGRGGMGHRRIPDATRAGRLRAHGGRPERGAGPQDTPVGRAQGDRDFLEDGLPPRSARLRQRRGRPAPCPGDPGRPALRPRGGDSHASGGGAPEGPRLPREPP